MPRTESGKLTEALAASIILMLMMFLVVLAIPSVVVWYYLGIQAVDILAKLVIAASTVSLLYYKVGENT